MDGDRTEPQPEMPDAELARRLLERGFYRLETPRRAPEGHEPKGAKD